MFFGGDNSAGVGGDLGNATGVITAMLTRAGMGDTISSGVGAGLAAKDDLDRRVEAKLRELYGRAEALLTKERWFVLAIANAMLQRRTVTGEDIDAIYHGARGPTVDGSWYHQPATRQRLEDFHHAAVAAHEAHEVAFDLDPPATPQASVATLPPPRAAIRLGRSWPPPTHHG
jgi:cell division protease FtsH